jgi:hypothetical protein
MIRYVFNEDRPLAFKNAKKANAQKIGEALSAIGNASDGRLMPREVVKAARPTNHILHKHFEWDNEVAAQHYREDQARKIISCVRVVNESESAEQGVIHTSPAFFSIADANGLSYRSLAVVMNSAELQLAVLQRAERDLEAFEKRYRDLGDICDLVREARGKAAERRTSLESRAHQ